MDTLIILYSLQKWWIGVILADSSWNRKWHTVICLLLQDDLKYLIGSLNKQVRDLAHKLIKRYLGYNPRYKTVSSSALALTLTRVEFLYPTLIYPRLSHHNLPHPSLPRPPRPNLPRPNLLRLQLPCQLHPNLPRPNLPRQPRPNLPYLKLPCQPHPNLPRPNLPRPNLPRPNLTRPNLTPPKEVLSLHSDIHLLQSYP